MKLSKINKNIIILATATLFLLLLVFLINYFNTPLFDRSYISTKGFEDIKFLSREYNNKIYFLYNDLNSIGFIENNVLNKISDNPDLPGEIILDAYWLKNNDLVVKLDNYEEILKNYIGYKPSNTNYYFGIYSVNGELRILPSGPNKVFIVDEKVFGVASDKLYLLKNEQWVDLNFNIKDQLLVTNNSKYFTISNNDEIAIFDSNLKKIKTYPNKLNLKNVYVLDNLEFLGTTQSNILYIQKDESKILEYKNIDNQILVGTDSLIFIKDKFINYININSDKTLRLIPFFYNFDSHNAHLVSMRKTIFTNTKDHKLEIIEVR